VPEIDFNPTDIWIPLAATEIALVAVIAAQWLLLKTLSAVLKIKPDSWLLPSAKNDFDGEWDKAPPKPL
jgi:hypothetical protein